MAKTNWTAHCQDFLSQSNTSAKARSEYAEGHGLNDNSFRRELTKFKKSLEADQLQGDQNSDQKADHSTRRDQKGKADQKKSEPNKDIKNQGVKNISGSKGRKAKADQGKSDQNGGATRARTTRDKSTSNVITRPDGTRSFTPGNTASLIHGAYSERLFHDQDTEALADMPISDMHKMMKARFSLMEMIRTDVIRQTQKDYEEGRAHTKEVFEDGELIQIPMTYEEAIFGSMLAGMKEQTKLYDSVVKAEQTQQSLYIQMRKMSQFTHEEATEEIAAVLERYNREELTAIEAGILLEGKGIRLPVTLKGLIEREIEEMEPRSKGEEGGLTEEQLNEIRSKALRYEAEEEGKVADNRAMLAELLREADDGI